MSERVLVVVPAFNAERTLGDVLEGCLQQTRELVVVDDGSSDGTSKLATEAGVEVLRHAKNRGKGAALKTAFAYAIERGYDAVVTLDADGQHLPADVPELLQKWRETGADLVIGSRAHLFHGMLPQRRLANRFSAWTIGWASKTGINDSQSGFRVYSAPLLRSVTLRTDGFDLESEVIIRAGRGGFRVVTTPVNLGFVDGVRTSHYKPLKDTLRIAWTVCRARLLWR